MAYIVKMFVENVNAIGDNRWSWVESYRMLLPDERGEQHPIEAVWTEEPSKALVIHNHEAAKLVAGIVGGELETVSEEAAIRHAISIVRKQCYECWGTTGWSRLDSTTRQAYVAHFAMFIVTRQRGDADFLFENSEIALKFLREINLRSPLI